MNIPKTPYTSKRQITMLRYIEAHPGCRRIDVIAACPDFEQYNRSSFYESLKYLENRGLIEDQRDEDDPNVDGRESRLYLTAEAAGDSSD